MVVPGALIGRGGLVADERRPRIESQLFNPEAGAVPDNKERCTLNFTAAIAPGQAIQGHVVGDSSPSKRNSFFTLL